MYGILRSISTMCLLGGYVHSPTYQCVDCARRTADHDIDPHHSLCRLDRALPNPQTTTYDIRHSTFPFRSASADCESGNCIAVQLKYVNWNLEDS